jgi:hypothetical protein
MGALEPVSLITGTEISMPLAIGFAFFIGIVVLVLLGSNLLGPDSWPIQSDREAARRAQANADRLRQRLRVAVPKTG